MVAFIKVAVQLLADAAWFVILLFRSTRSIQSKNLFLRRHLALLCPAIVRVMDLGALRGSKRGSNLA
jgi:hypothetical protein